MHVENWGKRWRSDTSFLSGASLFDLALETVYQISTPPYSETVIRHLCKKRIRVETLTPKTARHAASLGLVFLFTSGCAISSTQSTKPPRPPKISAAERSSLELRRKLRAADEKLAELKSKNIVLEKKIELLKLNREISSAEVLRSSNVSSALDAGKLSAPKTADELLAHAVLGHANMGNLDEAERTLALLQKSYPDSDLTQRTRDAYIVQLIEAGYQDRAAALSAPQVSGPLARVERPSSVQVSSEDQAQTKSSLKAKKVTP